MELFTQPTTARKVLSLATSPRLIETRPELETLVTENQIQLNAMASRLLGIRPKDKLVILSTFSVMSDAVLSGEIILEDGQTISDISEFYIVKGWLKTDKLGNAVKEKKILTKEEKEALIEAGEVDSEGKPLSQYVDAYTGCLMASLTETTNFVPLKGCDTANYKQLGGEKGKSITFEVSIQGEEVEVGVDLQGNPIVVTAHQLTRV